MTGALQEAEDKANRLGKTKGKLESSVQDVSICYYIVRLATLIFPPDSRRSS